MSNLFRHAISFCTTCGDHIRAVGRANSSIELAVNSRLLIDLEPWSISDKGDDNKGCSMGSPYEFTPYSGPPFSAKQPDEQVATGACHCGAVTIGMKGPEPAKRPLIIECNCNFCWRTARVHIYPSPTDVHLGGESNLSYTPAGKNLSAAFCKTCGCHMFSALDEGEADEATGVVPVLRREELGHEKFICAINVRVLEGVDAEGLEVTTYNGREKPGDWRVE